MFLHASDFTYTSGMTKGLFFTPLLAGALLCGGCVIPYKVTVPEVTGTVIDEHTGAGIPSATATLEGYPETRSTSAADGTFRTTPSSLTAIFSMPLGDRSDSFTLHTHAPGYTPNQKKLFVFRKESIDTGNIRLTPTP